MRRLAPTIYINQANLCYHDVLLFENLNLTLPAGKWTCLLGPSGVGKTSLLRLVAGLTSDARTKNPIQTSDGMPLNGRLAYMAQQDLLLPWCSVLDNVLIGARLRGEKKHLTHLRERAYHLLQKVGLTNAIDKKPAELSGGMRQRVVLVRTLLQDCTVVLMDEPFAALDMVARLHLQALAAELLAQCTVLLVTHDPLEALRLGDHIYVMAGLPAQLSEPLQLTGKAPRSPADPEVLALQGELLNRLAAAREIMPC
ncbi:MAG: ABC transporter ATP-binding protein [Gammaproteobacteria bacterium]